MFDFGLRIRELRESKNMSQETLGKRIGRSKPVISSYENNIKTPPLDVLIGMARVFNVSLDYLVGMKANKTVSVDGLTDKQINIIRSIIEDFQDKKQQPRGLTERQRTIINQLLNQFSN